MCLLLFSLILILPAVAETPQGWETDFSRAEKKARETNRKILVLFTGSDWSAESRKLQTEVLESPEFQAFAREKFVMVYIDFPRQKRVPEKQAAANQALRKKLRYYGGYPGTVLLNHNGRKLGQINGFRKKELYIDLLKGFQKTDTASSESSQSPGSAPAAEQSSFHVYNDTPEGWLSDFQQAKNKAAKQNRPILLLFTGSDWCGWCKKLKAEVLLTDAFKQFASKSLVLLYVDFPKSKFFPADQKARNQELKQRFLGNSGGFPTTVLLDKNGKEFGRFAGYSKQYLRRIEMLLRPLPPIVKASRENDLDAVMTLVAAGADVNAADGAGTTALHNAAHLGNLDMLRFLLEKGARIDPKNRWGATPLLSACGSHFATNEMLDCLIAEGANLNASDQYGQNALILSVIYPKADFIKRLLKEGTNVNHATSNGQTALFFAVGRNNYTLIKLLLENGADIKKADRQGLTALHHAAHNQQSRTGIVKLLLKAGADPNAKTLRGKTPFDLAEKNEIKELLRPSTGK